MSKKQQAELVQKIEAAFADAVYPGDDNLVNLYHDDVFCQECAEIHKTFKGRRWQTITKDVLTRNHEAVFLFRPDAYRYYLPAFLIAALRQLKTSDNLPPSTVFSLSPIDKETDYFKSRIRGFTAEQKQVIREFLELYAQNTAISHDKALKKALRYWREQS